MLQGQRRRHDFVYFPQATEAGLDAAEVKRRLDQYGYNKLPESTRIPFLVFLGYLWNPLSWAMEVAALLAIILLDYADFCLIIALLLVNATIRYFNHSMEQRWLVTRA